MDFIADQLVDGRRFRAQTVVGIYTRESLTIEAGQRMKDEDVVIVLSQILLQRGSPKVLFYDNGSEFARSGDGLMGLTQRSAHRLSRPGKTTDNAFVESFNGTLRAECLDAHWFATLAEAKQLIELWRRGYNESRPHMALGEQTPSEFAAQRELPGLQEPENSP